MHLSGQNKNPNGQKWADNLTGPAKPIISIQTEHLCSDEKTCFLTGCWLIAYAEAQSARQVINTTFQLGTPNAGRG